MITNQVDIQKIKYLKNKNKNITSYFNFFNDTMNLLYYDVSEMEEMEEILYLIYLKKIIYNKSNITIIPHAFKNLYILYEFTKQINNGDTSSFISFINDNDETSFRSIFENNKDKVSSNIKYYLSKNKEIMNDAKKKYNKLLISNKINDASDIKTRLEHYINVHHKYIMNMINAVKNHNENNETVEHIINNMIRTNTTCYFNNKNKSYIYGYLSDKYTKNIENIPDEYLYNYIKVIHTYLVSITKHEISKYIELYKNRLIYKTDEKYSMFRKNYNMIINCWYDIDKSNDESKYHVIKYDNDNLKCYIIKSQFVKAVNFRRHILDKINDNNGSDIKETDIFDNLKNIKIDDNNIMTSINSLFEKIESVTYTYKEATKNIKTVTDSVKHIRDAVHSTYEISSKKAKKFITDNYKNILRIKNITLEKYTELEKRLYDTYNIKPQVNTILDEIFNEMGYSTKENNSKLLEEKSAEEICKTCLFTYTDLKKNYGHLYFPKKKYHNVDELCFSKIKDKLYLEMIHPKFYYYIHINKDKYRDFNKKILKYYLNTDKNKKINHDFELEAYQKQGIFGITDYTVDFRKCHYFFFMGFRQFYEKDDNTMGHSIIDYYSYTLNKVINFCMSKRDNLFAIRFINDGTMAWHRPINNPYFEREFVKTLSGDDIIFLGVIQKKVNKLTQQFTEDDTLQVFVVYSKLYNGIFTLDETLSNVMDTVIKWPITFTFMELHQFCNYLGMYGYMYNDNKFDIYFSKFDIFNESEIYDKNVYHPLSLDEFNSVLIELRKKLIPINCFKFPPLMNVPSCALKELNDSNSVINDDNCRDHKIFIAKYSDGSRKNCTISKDHRTNPSGSCYPGYKIKNQFGGNNQDLFKLRFTDDIKYYYKNKDHVDTLYKHLSKYQHKYKDDVIKILEKGFNYEFVRTVSTLGYEKYNKYNYVLSDNKLQKFLGEQKIETILKYQNISSGFCEVYEFIHSHNFNSLLNSNSHILEISNFTTFLEAVHVYLNNNNFNMSNMVFDVLSPNIHMNPTYHEKMNVICKKFNINRKDIDMYKFLDSKKKYDVVFLAVRKKNIYSTTPIWIQNDNKIKIFYLLLSLLNLKKNGSVVMRFSWLRSKVQRDIFYLFKKIFKTVDLYIPECGFLVTSCDGIIIGKNYKNIINDNIIKKFLDNLCKVNDDAYYDFPDFFKKLNMDGPIKFIVKQEHNNNNKWIDSFINEPNNKTYEKILDDYFMNYYDKIMNCFALIKLHTKYPEDELLIKLKTGIEWAKKYGLDLNFSCDTNILNYDFEKYVINTIYKKKEFNILNFNNITLPDTNINLEHVINKYNKYVRFNNQLQLSHSHKFVIDELYPYMDIYKSHVITVKQKYLTLEWLIFYEIFNFYDIIVNDVNPSLVHIDAKNISVIKSVIQYYNKLNIDDNQNTNKCKLIIINRKKNITSFLNVIKKKKVNAVIRLEIGNINNIDTVTKICKIIMLYDNVYFHKSEIDHKNRTFLILKNYNDTKKNNIDNVIKKFLYMCTLMINFFINDEITKLYIINRYDVIDKHKSSQLLVEKLKKRRVDRYTELFFSSRL